MKESFHNFLGFEYAKWVAEPSEGDPRECWLSHSREPDQPKGNYTMRVWFAIQTVDQFEQRHIRIIIGKYSFIIWRS